MKIQYGMFPAIVATLLCVCALGVAQSEDWGEAVDGVQMRLNAVPVPANATPLTAMNLPAFEVQLRNQGRGPITVPLEGLTLSANIEIDGVWYAEVWVGSCCSRPEIVEAGNHTEVFKIHFDYRWLFATGSNQIELKPGVHTIRFRTPTEGRFAVTEGSAARPIVLISNRVTIDIPDVPVSAVRQALIASVSKGGQLPGVEVSQLVEKYPDAALGALQAAILRTDSPFVRGELIMWLNKVPGEDVSAYLRSNWTSGTDFASRSAALLASFLRKDPNAVPATVVAWNDFQPILRQWNPEGSDMIEGTRFAAGRFISVLAESQDAHAIDVLARSLPQEPIDIRIGALHIFLPPTTRGWSATGVNISLHGKMPELPGGAAGLAIERLLAAGLNDTEQRTGISGNFNEFSYKDPRVCDIAALVFSVRWPAKYPFQWSDSVAERDRQIRGILNAWRAEHPQ